MRFLIDAPLPPRLAVALNALGHEAVHVREIGMQAADDKSIFQFAADNDYIIITADLDFAALAAARQAQQPSVLILRVGNVKAQNMIDAALRAVAACGDRFATGIIAVTVGDVVRIRQLPI